jgi:hypothetical protein
MMRYLPALALVLALVACKGGEKETGGTAAGQILPGSASDAMIQYDQLTSQPPLAPHRAGQDTSPDAEVSDDASDIANPDAVDLAIPATAAAPVSTSPTAKSQ